MKIFKFLFNDYILFFINLFVLIIIYLNFILNENLTILIEILIIGMSYYFISLFTSIIILFFLYICIKNVFDMKTTWSILKKLQIVSYIFYKYFNEINYIKDFELKLKIFID